MSVKILAAPCQCRASSSAGAAAAAAPQSGRRQAGLQRPHLSQKGGTRSKEAGQHSSGPTAPLCRGMQWSDGPAAESRLLCFVLQARHRHSHRAMVSCTASAPSTYPLSNGQLRDCCIVNTKHHRAGAQQLKAHLSARQPTLGSAVLAAATDLRQTPAPWPAHSGTLHPSCPAPHPWDAKQAPAWFSASARSLHTARRQCAFGAAACDDKVASQVRPRLLSTLHCNFRYTRSQQVSNVNFKLLPT